MITNQSITVPTRLLDAPILYGIDETNMERRIGLLKYVWCVLLVPTLASSKYAGVIGIDEYSSLLVPHGVVPQMYTGANLLVGGEHLTRIECRLYNYSGEVQTIPSNTRLYISSMFINEIGAHLDN